ncbi:MAG: polyisoprenoid-binding protein YceI, partial [Ulvibacter sp.]
MVQQEEIKLFMRRVGSFLAFFASLALFMINNSYAKDYQIDSLKSRIVFSGKHADNKFTGDVQKYQSKIIFDKNDLQNSKIEVIFDMNSFKTGNDIYDGTLPSKDWLNVKNYPQ